MATKELALHEQLEVHEVLIFKTGCVTKSIKDLRKVLADASK